MDGWDLTSRQRKRLERVLHETCSARVYRRALAMLEVNHGMPVEDVAKMVGVSRQSVYNWLSRYDSAKCSGSLADQPRSGRPGIWTAGRKTWLGYLMQICPTTRGYFANTWTVPLLQEELFHCTGRTVSEDTIRRELSRLGYVWKRSRYVLLPDPDQEKKTADSPENQESDAAERLVGRGRDRPADISTVAVVLGLARRTGPGSPQRAQRAPGHLRRVEPAHGASLAAAARAATRDGFPSVSSTRA